MPTSGGYKTWRKLGCSWYNSEVVQKGLSFRVNLLFGIIVILHKCSDKFILRKVEDFSGQVYKLSEHFRERVKVRESEG